MSDANAEYLQYVDQPAANSGELTQLQQLAEAQADAERDVASAEATLKAAQDRLKQLREIDIPTLMDSIGIEEFKTRTGIKIKIEETIRASIPKPRQFEAFAWLRANNSEALIKREVSVSFGKGQSETAEALLNELHAKGLPVENHESVHAQTLSAWVREKLKNGVEFPQELFGVFRQRASKIELPKV